MIMDVLFDIFSLCFGFTGCFWMLGMGYESYQKGLLYKHKRTSPEKEG